MRVTHSLHFSSTQQFLHHLPGLNDRPLGVEIERTISLLGIFGILGIVLERDGVALEIGIKSMSKVVREGTFEYDTHWMRYKST